nr:hypothetical protein [Tanacetum cinerariifolium]
MTNEESVKDMTSKFDKLVKFERQDFRRWPKKMYFLLTTLKVVYVLSTPCLVWSENETLETTRKRMKWENDDYICRGHILNGMSDSLFDIYQNAESAKALWEPIIEQYHEMLRILGQYTHHKLMMDEAISVAIIIDKLPTSWKEFKYCFKHKKEELNLNQIGSSSVNMVERDGAKNSNNNKNKRKFKSSDDKFVNKKGTVTCWECKKTSHMKKDCRSRKGNDGAGSNGSKDPEKQQDDEVAWWVDSGATSHVCKDIQLQRQELIKVLRTDRGGEYYDPIYFQSTGIIHQTTAPYTPQQNGVTERKNMTLKEMVNSMLSYYGLKPNDYVSVNSIIESRDAIFNKERFTSITRPRGMIQPSSSKIVEDEVEEGEAWSAEGERLHNHGVSSKHS